MGENLCEAKKNKNNCVYSSEPAHNIQVAPLKYWVYKILKSETNFAEIPTQFAIHWSSGNWSDIEKELETGVSNWLDCMALKKQPTAKKQSNIFDLGLKRTL